MGIHQFKTNVIFFQAFERFAEDVDNEDDDHLDLPLIHEQNLLNEYKRLLE